MPLSSMTGFARTDGALGALRWAWEIKTVNGRGLDIRLRMPSGLDAVEAEARTRIASRLSRGNCNATLTVTREAAETVVRIDQRLLDSLIDTLEPIRTRIGAPPLMLDTLLGIRGVVEIVEAEDDAGLREGQNAAMLETLDGALDALVASRDAEGRALALVLAGRLDEIERLTRAADENPARQPEAIQRRLADQIAAIAAAHSALDASRLHQEALILAGKADIREELDRLYAHVAAGRDLLAQSGAVGRRLDFLAQEFGRETNTLCSKSNSVSLTATGLELKAVVEQFREQVQNIE